MIEVGEYVRLKDGKIRQFKQYINEEIVELTRPYSICKEKDIVKHSKNIIDLIEVGDYVNGFEVIETDTGYEVDSQIVVSTPTYKEVYLLEEDIETILTKELYQSNCYTVERKE